MEKEESAARRKRNTAFLFIGAGIFLILERQVGFFSVIAFASIVFGIYRIWSQADKKGYLLVIIGVFFIFEIGFFCSLPSFLFLLDTSI